MSPVVLAVVVALVLVIGGFIIASQRGPLLAAPPRPEDPKVPKAPPVPTDLGPIARSFESPAPGPAAPIAPVDRGPSVTPVTNDLAGPRASHAAPEPTDALELLPSIALKVAPSTSRLSVPPGSPQEVEGLRRRLVAPRAGFLARLAGLFRGKPTIDAGVWERMEEVLLTSDVGVATADRLVKAVRARVEESGVADVEAVWQTLKAEAFAILDVVPKRPVVEERKTNAILLVGVNGVGKTTTIGKLATRWKTDGRTIVLGAADTFRAAAVAQLEAWGRRIGVTVVKGKDGADPASVAFEATKKAVEPTCDPLLHFHD